MIGMLKGGEVTARISATGTKGYSLHISEMAIRPPPDDEVRYNGCDSSEQEEEAQEAVHLAGREEHLGADDAPDDGRGVEHLRARAHEVVLLRRGAYVGDVLEHPGLHAELHNACDHGCDDLAPEHRSWPGGRSVNARERRFCDPLTGSSCSGLISYPR